MAPSSCAKRLICQANFDTQLQTWDMAFKDTKNADFVVRFRPPTEQIDT